MLRGRLAVWKSDGCERCAGPGGTVHQRVPAANVPDTVVVPLIVAEGIRESSTHTLGNGLLSPCRSRRGRMNCPHTARDAQYDT